MVCYESNGDTSIAVGRWEICIYGVFDLICNRSKSAFCLLLSISASAPGLPGIAQMRRSLQPGTRQYQKGGNGYGLP